MAIYLKQFETQAAYEAAQSGLILPNVSLTVDNNAVHYNPYVDPYAGHDYVDLGLPSGIKWAKYNVGASSETDYGDYYKYGNGANKFEVGQPVYTGTEQPLAASADTAAQVMGGGWRMPTCEEFSELMNNTRYGWTTINGISGGIFTSYRDSSKYLFFPANGQIFWDGTIEGRNSYGRYWASTDTQPDSTFAMCFQCQNSSKTTNAYNRSLGFGVRGVIKI